MRRSSSRDERRPASLFVNTLSGSASTTAGYVLSFVSAPIILSGLGLRAFGIWALTGGLAQYGALLDLGMMSWIGRFVALHGEERSTAGEYVVVGFLIAPALTVVLGLAAIVAAAPIAHDLGGISVSDMRIVLLSSVALLGSGMLASAWATYSFGRRRMVVPNIAGTLGMLANFVASVGSILLGARLVGYALANVGAGLVALVVQAGLIVRYEGAPPVGRLRLVRVRELLGFSIKAQVVALADLINLQTDKLIIAFSIGPAAAGAYELANRAAIAVRVVGVWPVIPLTVELSAEAARGGLEAVRRRYARLTAVTSALGLAPVLVAIATAPLLLSVWLASVPRYSTAVLVALCVSHIPAATSGVSYGVAVAVDRPGIVARVAIIAAVVNVVLTAALAPLFGIWGILAGTTIAIAGGQFAQIIVVHRTFALPRAEYLDAVWPPLRIYVALAVPVGLVCFGVPVHGRIFGAAVLVALGAAYFVACGAWAARHRRLPGAVLQRLPRRARAALAAIGG